LALLERRVELRAGAGRDHAAVARRAELLRRAGEEVLRIGAVRIVARPAIALGERPVDGRHRELAALLLVARAAELPLGLLQEPLLRCPVRVVAGRASLVL